MAAVNRLGREATNEIVHRSTRCVRLSRQFFNHSHVVSVTIVCGAYFQQIGTNPLNNPPTPSTRTIFTQQSNTFR